jgi:hypothetical protein
LENVTLPIRKNMSFAIGRKFHETVRKFALGKCSENKKTGIDPEINGTRLGRSE